MSWTDEELDHLFKDAAAKQKVPYSDAYWKEMEAMLGKKKRRGAFWWWFSGVVVLLFGIGATTWLFMEPVDMTEQRSTMAQSNPVKAQDRIVNEGLNEEAIDGITSDEHIEFKKTKEEKLQESGTSTNSSRTEASTSEGESQQVAKKAEGMLGPSFQPEGNGVDLSTHSLGSKEDISSVVEPETVRINTLEEEVIEELTEIEIDALNTRTKGNVTHTLPNDLIVPQALPSLASKGMDVYLEMNSGLAQSYVVEKNAIGWTSGFNAGVELYRNNWTSSIGLGVRYESYDNIEVQYERKYYSFGAIHTQGNQQFNNFLRVEMPVQLSYSFGRMHLTAGVVPSYLIGVQSAVKEELKESYTNLDATPSSIGYNAQWMRSEKFNAFGISPMVGLGYAIAPKWSVDLSYQTQLMKVINEELFSTEVKNMPGMIQIGIRKRF